MKTRWQWKKFQTLKAKELHQIYMLRASVFCEEHGKAYKDPDEKDREARHLLCFKENPEPKYSEDTLIAYARIPYRKVNNGKLIVERIVVHKDFRNQGIEQQLMKHITDKCDSRYPNKAAHLTVPTDKFSEKLPELYATYGFKFEKPNPKIVSPEAQSENISTTTKHMKREAINARKQQNPEAVVEAKPETSKLAKLGMMGLGAAAMLGLCFFAGTQGEAVAAVTPVRRLGPAGI